MILAAAFWLPVFCRGALAQTSNPSGNLVFAPTGILQGRHTTTEGGASVSFTMCLSSQPASDVSFSWGSNDTSEGTVSPSTQTFTPANWSTPQTVTVTGVDDALADGAVSFVVAPTLLPGSDPDYNGFSGPNLQIINQDDDSAALIYSRSETDVLSTSEDGGSASFTVRLAKPPLGNVSVAWRSSDTSEGTVSPATQTFTPTNWSTPQALTVTGVDDTVQDSRITFVVSATVASGGDLDYDGLPVPEMTVVNEDNDTAGFAFNPAELVGRNFVTTEGGGSATFTVRLTKQPNTDLSLAWQSSDTSEGVVSPETVTFTQANWSTPQTVTITGVDDAVQDGAVSFTVSATVVPTPYYNDYEYSGLTIPAFEAINEDDDKAELKLGFDSISQAAQNTLTTSEGGGSATFTVRLAKPPLSDVSVAWASSDSTEGTASPSTQTFTAANWSVPQIVTVTGVNDALADGAVLFRLVSTVTSSGDSSYHGLQPVEVSAINQDDDMAVPPAPTGLQAVPGNSHISLSWGASTGAVGYLVRRALVGGGPYEVIERVTQPQYIDTNVRNGRAYFYLVAALAGNGSGGESAGPNSNKARATPQSPPVAPFNLTVTAGDRRAYLAWGSGARTEVFEVWRSINGGAWAKIAEPTSASYINTGLTNGRVHQYYVLARNSGGESRHSNSVSVVPAVGSTFAPGPPTFGTRTSTSIVVIAPALPLRATSLSLQKRAAGYYSGYGDSNLYVTVANEVAGGAAVTVSGLTPRSSYAFRWVAVGSGGEAESYETTANTLPLAPGAPEKPAFSTVERTTLTILTPSLPTDALGFTLQRKLLGAPDSDYRTVYTSVSGNSNLSVSGLLDGTRYVFRLLAVGQGGTTPGPPATVRTAPEAPAAPQFSQVTATSVQMSPGSATLPLGAVSLRLEREYGYNTWITLASGLSATSATVVSGLAPEMYHTFRFVAVGEDGRTVGAHGYVQTPSGTSGAPGAPQYSEVTSTSVVVVAPSEVEYNSLWTVQRKEAGQPDSAFADLGTVHTYSSSLAVSGLSEGTAYAFRFVSGAAPDTIFGAASTVTTAPSAPGVPTLSSRTTTSLTLAMPTLPPGAVSLRLERMYGEYYYYYGSSVVLAQGLIGGQTVTISDLAPRTIYTVRCVAVGPDGETVGLTAPFNTAWEPPSPPEAPGFTQRNANQVTVAALPLPDAATGLTLQQKLAGAPDSDYIDVATGKDGQSTTDVPGLAPGTAYSFRWVAVGEGGTVPGPGAEVSTLPLPPEAPAAPDLSYADTTSASVLLPALPLRATSLTLQKSTFSGYGWVTVATEEAGGAILTVTDLTPGQSTAFRCIAVGPGGETIGAAATINMPNGPPEAPLAPRFTDVREGGLTVLSPAMPAGAYSMKLQGKWSSDPNTAYEDLSANVGANVNTEVDGMDTNTSYDFRYVALGDGGSTPGAVASVLMPTASVAWGSGQPISCGGISYPRTGATLQLGQAGRLSAYLATDWDQRLKTANGLANVQDISDPCSYTWTASGGSFAGGDSTGQSVVWVAPTTPGTYTLTLVVDDQNGQNKTAQEAGGRNDAGRGFNEEPQRFSMRVTVGATIGQ